MEPSTGEMLSLGAQAVLRDGSHVRLRQGHSSDREMWLRGFARLSPESRYRRFLTGRELTETDVRYLTEIDHRDHEAIVAIDERTGEGIGVARYIRDRGRADAAEVAVTVIDDWQGRGVGTLLLEALAGRACSEGIRHFTALLLASNQEMRHVLEALGPVRTVDEEVGTIELEMPVGEGDPSPALRKLLRVLARHPISCEINDQRSTSAGRRIESEGAPGGADARLPPSEQERAQSDHD